MLLANRGKPVIDGPAQRPGLFQRLGLDPAERAEERQHARLHPLTVHPREVEIDLVEGLGERLFAHSSGFQHFDAVLVARDTRFPGTGAQGVGDFGGPPMGMHVDHHGCLLHPVSGSLTPRRLGRKARELSRPTDGTSRPRGFLPSRGHARLPIAGAFRQGEGKDPCDAG
jgi:hypothetical protein